LTLRQTKINNRVIKIVSATVTLLSNTESSICNSLYLEIDSWVIY
jgi:hypothetical protein